ncbi:hypothetical protein [Chromobacterium violaceum]|uniref:hypothetical protein n=1 Tax=Chromobacterium violaceum TaxID=536 RepID=UPI0015F7A1A5|nr:hypothetical protein [Chromobacterium violaceum]MBA8737415.1 hypothetical protein [Chromobacterium violaceum]
MRNQSVLPSLLAVTGSALLLSACGGGGGDSNSSSATPTPTQQVSGKAIDGYLVGATVCLDLNDNGVCDSGEPSTTTQTDGSYSLPVSGTVTGKKLLLVVTSSTKDLSRPGYTFPASFTLSTILSDTANQHVTPLTSLVAAQMEAGLSRAAAQQNVATLVGGAVDLNADYIAGQDSATSALASKVVDKITTFAANGKADPDTVRAVLNAITEKGNVDQVTPADVTAHISQPVYSRNVDAAAILKAGTYSWYGLLNGSGAQPVAVRELDTLSSAGYQNQQQKYVSPQWQAMVWGEFSPNAGEYELKADGSWTDFLSSQNPEPAWTLQQVDGNAITATHPLTGISARLELRAAKLDGKPIAAVMKGMLDSTLLGQIHGNFAVGSTGYATFIRRTLDLVSISDCNPATHNNQPCNVIGDPTQSYRAVDQVFGLDIPISANGNLLRLNADGTAAIRDANGQVLTSQVRWSRLARNANVLVLSIALNDAKAAQLNQLDDIQAGNQIAIALRAGHLQLALVEPASIDRGGIAFSSSTFDQFFTALKAVLGWS